MCCLLVLLGVLDKSAGGVYQTRRQTRLADERLSALPEGTDYLFISSIKLTTAHLASLFIM